jgi:hypothetical protein
MSLTRQQLTTNYASAMREGDAALFIGAGMSRPAGFLDWRNLLRECARELGLDIDNEHDLIAVAQYYLNRRNRDRARLNRILKNEFDRPGTFSRSHEVIGRLPITTVWTTNFDKLLEKAFERAGRQLDVKWKDSQIPLAAEGREVTMYKMHGDIASPDEIIICKDDYERYARRHELFQNQLAADLVNKTLLFLGFSFTDPHLDYMLGHLRSLLEDSKREHFAVMRKARLNTHDKDKAKARRIFEYELNKQALQIEDLQRYSIHTHLIDSFDEVTGILEEIESRYYLRNIFVSGSAHEFGDFGEERARDLCMRLGERLIAEDYRLISGMGLKVGDYLVKGALLKLYEMGIPAVEKHLTLRPFPRNLPAEIDEGEFNAKYRRDMIAKCGFAIFIAGTSRSHPESAGVLQEYEIARALKRIPIPIGATGFAARRIWETMKPEIADIYADAVPARTFKQLNEPGLTNEQLVNVVFEVIRRVSESAPGRATSTQARAAGR